MSDTDEEFYYSESENENESESESENVNNALYMHLNLQESTFQIKDNYTADDIILQVKCLLTSVDKSDYNILLTRLLRCLRLSDSQLQYAKHIFKKQFGRLCVSGNKRVKFHVNKDNMYTLKVRLETVNEDDEEETSQEYILAILNYQKKYNSDWFILNDNKEEKEDDDTCIIL